MLLSLTTVSCVSGLQYLHIRYLRVGIKANHHLSLTIIGFSDDPQLCVIETLDTYLDRTKGRRFGKSQLLLSFQKPYKEVVSSIISGWIKKVLRLAKVDTDMYKAHSTCSASTLHVKLKGFSFADILK